jgi:hypothetical protein
VLESSNQTAASRPAFLKIVAKKEKRHRKERLNKRNLAPTSNVVTDQRIFFTKKRGNTVVFDFRWEMNDGCE